MPKRTDLKRVLIIGSGPIVIGQACEFDYSGSQACKALRSEGLDVPLSGVVKTVDQARALVRDFGKQGIKFPFIIRPSFTLGGVGGGIAYNIEEFGELVERGLDLSPVHEILIEESVIGWKEFE